MGSAASQWFLSSCSHISNLAGGRVESRNWEQLPRDVMVTILMKLSPREVLESVQLVCKPWYEASKDPAAWSKVEIRGESYSDCENMKLSCNAIRRGGGFLLEISLVDVPMYLKSYSSLLDIAKRSTQLRCLRIRRCKYVPKDDLFEAVKKLPLLEEAEFTDCYGLECSIIKSVGQCCPNLVSFKLNECINKEEEGNQKALAIAETMPGMRHLQLIASSMTNEGLQAILDNCHCLQSLDLRACFQVDLQFGNLGERLANEVKNLKLPFDSTSDYGFENKYGHGFEEVSCCLQ